MLSQPIPADYGLPQTELRVRKHSGCRRCVCCSTQELSATSRHSEFQEWWPTGFGTPTTYFFLRRRQLAVTIKQNQACRPAGVWRAPEDIIASSPSQLRMKRGLQVLSLNVPASHTNIDQADTTVQYIRTVKVGLSALPKPLFRERPAIQQPAAAACIPALQPAKPAAAAAGTGAQQASTCSGHLLAPATSSLLVTPFSVASWLVSITPQRAEPARGCSPMSVCSDASSLSAQQLSAMSTGRGRSSAASSSTGSPSGLASVPVIDLRHSNSAAGGSSSSSSRRQSSGRRWACDTQSVAGYRIPTPVDLEAGYVTPVAPACPPQAAAAPAPADSLWGGFMHSLLVGI